MFQQLWIIRNLNLEDKWILSKLQTASKLINENMEKYELDAAAKFAYEFFVEISVTGMQKLPKHVFMDRKAVIKLWLSGY